MHPLTVSEIWVNAHVLGTVRQPSPRPAQYTLTSAESQEQFGQYKAINSSSKSNCASTGVHCEIPSADPRGCWLSAES